MCGFGALVLTGDQKLPSLQAMLDSIRHRGPDDEGWVAFSGKQLRATFGGGPDTAADCFGASLPYAPDSLSHVPDDARLVLGHRRLSVMDVSPGGHQPMSFENGRFWIVFNGEIYNFGELRATLEGLGRRFLSSSDTEVLLASYAEWGRSCLDRLEGMFSFIIVDRSQGTLFAARDRFGIKPLYYWVGPQGFLAFASEIKQFSFLPGWKAVLNGQRAYDFLAWGILDHTDETMFANVYQLRPGTFVEIELNSALSFEDGGRVESGVWYNLSGDEFSAGIDEAAKGFRDRFGASLRAHLQSDVPVGSCLSGGLDSSSIVCLVNHILRVEEREARQYAFSSCSTIPRYDERNYVEEVASYTGAEVTYLYPDLDQLFDKLDLITWHQDEPFGSTSIFAQWSVFSVAARSGLKVLLDGQGADEQLAGYRGYHGALYANLFKRLRWIELWREVKAARDLHGYSVMTAMKYLVDAFSPSFIRYFLRAVVGKETASPNWLDLKRIGAVACDPIRGGQGASRSIRDLSFRQLTRSNLQMLLHWEDRGSMAHSLEARVPFLDHRLVEFLLGLPDSYKLHRGVTKRVLREGMIGFLPELVRTRMSKLGFATPEEYWICTEAPETFRRALSDAVVGSQGVLRPEAMSMLEDAIAGRRPFDFTVWRLISFAAWMKRFGVKVS